MTIRFLSNFALGCFVGALSALIVAWIIDETVSAAYQKNWIYLFSALITLAAASLALMGTLSVISNQNKVSKDQKDASLRAAKATLPLALSELVRACNAGIKYADKDASFFKSRENREDYERDTAISTEVLATIQSCIEYSDGRSGKWLSVVVQYY
ncbi:hypothetical protein [Leisingera sp. F5]|uniref:hypothetical protein n=1 Tax=Leisingera sp. F5 TaxID=1813816 RepID=UPI0025C18670|nr:hypothetical protein [Leisingera sp. F5]